MANVNPNRTRKSQDRPGRQKVQRTRPRVVKKSLPTWAILLGFAVVILLVIQLAGITNEEAFDAGTSHVKITDALKHGDSKKAEEELEKVARNDGRLTTEWRQTFAALRIKSKGLSKTSHKSVDHMAGTKYLQKSLRNYESGYLAKDPGRPRARIFVQRAQHFLATWPTHPEADEVRNKLNRWESVAELSSPANLADIMWETKTLTWAFPRDYAQAMPMLESFRDSATGGDLTIIEGVINTHISEREEYFLDRFEQAAYLWDKGDPSKALEYLVQLITKIGDPQMSERAAQAMVAFHGQLSKDGRTILSIVDSLQGYKSTRRRDFDRMVKNATCAAFFRKQGLL
jgi:hypothetical protein